ncbi:MAG TPA: phosphatidylglycerol lysyltransferase domain-containing protein [Streptosporangiaceae bacterium]
MSELASRGEPGPSQPGAGRAGQPSESPAVRPPDRRQHRRWVPITAGWLALLIGLGDIIGGARPGLYHERLHRLAEIANGTLSNLSRTADVLIGLMLLMLSHALRRRKKRAWEAVILLLATSVLLHVLVLVRDRHFGPAIVSGALLVALACFRGEFYAIGDPRTRWRALWVLAGLAIADVVIGLSYISLARGLDGDYSPAQRIQSVLYGLAGVTGPVRFTHDIHNDRFGFLTGGLGLFTLVVTAYVFLRPAVSSIRPADRDTGRIRDLLSRYGDRDSLGYFALRDDKSIIWSPSGKSCIGYRVVSGVMLASGDPIGDAEAWPGVMHAFLDEAARHAWVPAVIGCSELGAEIWCREGGLTALELGDEAVVSVADFSLAGRPMRNVRQMVTRVARHGYAATVRRVGDIPEAEIRDLVRQADSWRGSPTERGFSMALGRVGGRGDDQCVVATATEDGVLRALLHFVPWGSDGLSLDLMRRDRGSQPGLNDFLIVETVKQAPALGVKRISLNFAVFRSALERGERIGAGPVLRAWRRILVFMSRWFQIESLYKFNAKFCPLWVPRFLVYPSTRDTPRIGLAALEAEAFLVWPKVELRRLARKLGLTPVAGRLRRAIRAPRAGR